RRRGHQTVARPRSRTGARRTPGRPACVSRRGRRGDGRRGPESAQRIQDRTRQTRARPRADACRSGGMIGEGIDRVDGRLKVTGGTTYSAEWPIERLTYGVIVQSTISCGSITAFDTASASRQPGVLAILTADNAARLPRKGHAGVNPPAGRVLSLFQDREVRYNGEPVALVIAET